MNLDAFLERLATPFRANGDAYDCHCPAHEDHTASLSVTAGDDGRILLHCHAGCTVDAVLEKLGLQKKDLFPSTNGNKKAIVAAYDYRDERDRLLYQVVRFAPKDFRQRRLKANGEWLWNIKGVTRVLYRLPELLADPLQTVFIVEGEKDVDALRAIGAVATTNPGGAGKWHDDYRQALRGRRVVIIPDNDEPGRQHAQQVAESLAPVAASVRVVDFLPGVPEKGDVSDYLTDRKLAHSLETLLDLVETTSTVYVAPPPLAPVAPCTLERAHQVVKHWFGDQYDMDAYDAMLATIAAERLTGDPVWLLIISGPGFTKTETVIAASGMGAFVTSTITSEAALLSGTPKHEKQKGATGGLLRRIGSRGVLVIKDVTSILSMHRDSRTSLLAAFREIYDGRWERNLGTDGGKTLTWEGKIAVIGACTTAWDQAHAVISSMGDRFVVIRLDSTRGRLETGRQAIGNTGSEITMRAELAKAVGGVFAGLSTTTAVDLTVDEIERILNAANLVTLCRTSVEYDYQGRVIDAHAPEAPTRFAKQLAQIIRGGCAIGMEREQALRLALRCARDSMPPLRLAILTVIQAQGSARTSTVRKILGKPWTTVDRQLQSLHMLGVLACAEKEQASGPDVDGQKRIWTYSLAKDINPLVLSPEMSVSVVSSSEERDQDLGVDEESGTPPPDKAGEEICPF